MSSERVHSSFLGRATPKPAKGSAKQERIEKRAALDYAQDKAKHAAKRRDGHQCRKPGCANNLAHWRLESAHLDDKGMGGDHGLRSGERSDYVSLCFLCHQGPRSIHSGDLRMEPLTAQRGDGLVRFDELTEAGWVTLGIS